MNINAMQSVVVFSFLLKDVLLKKSNRTVARKEELKRGIFLQVNKNNKSVPGIYLTKFTKFPIASIEILISSPECKVKSLPGTMPVPVITRHPLGNEHSR